MNDEARELRDVLMRNGFVRCDISVCNCGSWHARYGLPERMFEIKEALSDAGHPLCNDNGNLGINALADLVNERNALLEALETVRNYGSESWADNLIDMADKALSISRGDA